METHTTEIVATGYGVSESDVVNLDVLECIEAKLCQIHILIFSPTSLQTIKSFQFYKFSNWPGHLLPLPLNAFLTKLQYGLPLPALLLFSLHGADSEQVFVVT